ncbi:MAG: glycosyltransferase family 4 protein [Candidatus Peribacteraceae bacterium]|nr:glycosyltransferase family 4 protein [Candidatus Peribacteraceae bacterium]
MIKILSIENCPNWSWSLKMTELLRFLPKKFEIARMHRGFTPGAVDSLTAYFDLTLVQNADIIKQITTKSRRKVIGRMGGIRTFADKKTVFDEELKSVGGIISTNGELNDVAVRNNPNCMLIPNGVDLTKFIPRERGLPYDDIAMQNKFTVGFAGNVSGKYSMNYKGYRYFLGAVDRMILDVDRKSVLYGYSQVEHDDMPEKFLHCIDCLVLPSCGEGCSNITSEALACGVPVITTRVGYHGEMLEEGINCMFIERDINSIIGAIKTLKNDDNLRLGLSINSRRFAEEHHDIKKVAKAYSDMFELVLNNNMVSI